jgi:hypothetical protein
MNNYIHMCINMQLYLNKRNKKRERENKNKPALSQSPQQAQLVPTTHLPLAHLLAAAQRPQTLAAWVSQPSRHPACRRASRGARPRCSSSRRNNRAHVVQIPGKNGFPSLPCSSQRFSLARRRAGRNRVAGLELARSSTAPVEVNPPSPSLPRPPFFFVAMRVWASVAVRGSPMAASMTSAVRGSPMAARRARALARPRPGLGLPRAVRCTQWWPSPLGVAMEPSAASARRAAAAHRSGEPRRRVTTTSPWLSPPRRAPRCGQEAICGAQASPALPRRSLHGRRDFLLAGFISFRPSLCSSVEEEKAVVRSCKNQGKKETARGPYPHACTFASVIPVIACDQASRPRNGYPHAEKTWSRVSMPLAFLICVIFCDHNRATLCEAYFFRLIEMCCITVIREILNIQHILCLESVLIRSSHVCFVIISSIC